MMVETQATVIIEEVWKYYGKIKALENVNLRIQKGEIFFLLGPNGSGKSTLLRILSTIFSPDKGRFSLFGRDGIRDRAVIRKQIGILSEHSSHWDRLTGYENAWFFASYYNIPQKMIKNRLNDLFRRFGLWEKRNDAVVTYSYGMRRKLSIIEAFVHQPKLLLLDEPSMGLDYVSRLKLFDLMEQEALKGTTIIVATNDVNEASQMAKRVALLRQGTVVITDEPMELVKSLKALTRITLWVASPIPLTSLQAINGVEGVAANKEAENSFQIVFLVRDGRKILPHIVNEVVKENGAILGMDVNEPNLGDVFLKLTREEIH
ncbi:ABC transporter ATP-binding protein [Candidatus Borrarchaeum sp.]|uniref:ABC transporter ATP-binding protein n=1 Tax=Candidatus Borrarchaeum sp. TaxID=2846742 RepID=UPI00257D8035|nr:ABC transporter ATP-binding protein [Candidatus Borrarchaeum sp.]